MIVALLAFLLAMLIFVALAETEGDEEEASERSADAYEAHPRVNALIGALNYGTPETVESTHRRLLSMGPQVAGELFDTLLRLDASPQAFTAATQLRVEDVIADFGLAGYLAMRDRFEGLDDAHPAYAAALRVFDRVGVLVLEQLLNEPEPTIALFLDAFVVRMPDAAAAYLAAEGARLPGTKRKRLLSALRVSGREQVHAETPEALSLTPPDEEPDDERSEAWVAWASHRISDATVREELLRRVVARAPYWHAAAIALASVALDDVVQAAARHLREHPDALAEQTWCAIAEALGPPFVRFAVEAAVDANPSRASRGRAMLRDHAPERWVRIVCGRVGRQRAVFKLAAAAKAIAEAGAEQHVVAALDDPDVAVRAGAVRLCGRLRVKAAVAPLLERALAEPDARRLVAIALETQGSAALSPLLAATADESCPAELHRVAELLKGSAERGASASR